MQPEDRFKLWYAPYKTPRFKFGSDVWDDVRGRVTIVGVTDAKIPWPIGKLPGRRRPSPVVYKKVAKAVQRESNLAVQHGGGASVEVRSKSGV